MGADSCEPREPCTRRDPDSLTARGTSDVDIMQAHCNNNVDYAKVDVRWRCGLLSNFLGHLFECIIQQMPKNQHCVENDR